MSESRLTVLLVDDEEFMIESCRRILEHEGFRVTAATRGRVALDLLERDAPDIVLTDLRLPDLDGLALLKAAKALDPDLVVIMITGFATVDSSIEAIRAGAYDYIPKPFTATQLQILLGRAARQVELARENRRLRHQVQRELSLENMIGQSPVMQAVFALAHRIAPTEANVFISGESGTGKELVARAIHGRSRRSAGPFVAVNCAAFPEHLLESELFGHEKGAFTGAGTQKRGLLEHASGGTFFLDEVCEMSQELQAKLLRVLQERKIRRVGGAAEIAVDVRVVAATNRDPQQAVEERVLRRDLYFRLNVIPVRLPPLRERRDDIPALAHHFLGHYAQRYGKDTEGPLRLTGEALDALRAYAWPGNVRELQNVMERVVSLAQPGQEIALRDLPDEVLGEGRSAGPRLIFRADLPFHEAKDVAIAAFETAYLRDLLERHDGNISSAARAAGIDRKTIHRLLRKHDVAV